MGAAYAPKEAREPSFAFYESIYRSSACLSKRARGAFCLAVLAFYFDGREPDDLPKDAALLFAGTRYRFERARSTAIAKGTIAKGKLSNAQQDAETGASEPLPYAYEADSDAVDEAVPDDAYGVTPAETRFGHADVSPDVPLDGLGLSLGLGLGQTKVSFPACENETNEVNTLDERLDAAAELLSERGLETFDLFEEQVSKWVEGYHDAGWLDRNGADMDKVIVSNRYGPVQRWKAMLLTYAEKLEADLLGNDVNATGGLADADVEPPADARPCICQNPDCQNHDPTVGDKGVRCWRQGDMTLIYCPSCGTYQYGAPQRLRGVSRGGNQ